MDIPIPTQSLVSTDPAFALSIAVDCSVHITQAPRALILTKSLLICPSRRTGWLPHTAQSGGRKRDMYFPFSLVSTQAEDSYHTASSYLHQRSHIGTSHSMEPHVQISTITLGLHINRNLTLTSTPSQQNLTFTGTSRSHLHHHTRTSHPLGPHSHIRTTMLEPHIYISNIKLEPHILISTTKVELHISTISLEPPSSTTTVEPHIHNRTPTLKPPIL